MHLTVGDLVVLVSGHCINQQEPGSLASQPCTATASVLAMAPTPHLGREESSMAPTTKEQARESGPGLLERLAVGPRICAVRSLFEAKRFRPVGSCRRVS
jgi:hypothetical protein